MAEIRFVNVSKVFDEDVIALEHASFEIGQGEFLFFIGRNGAGKSTVFRLLMGQEAATSGEIYINGISVNAIRRRKLPYFRRQFGIMRQELGLLSDRTVWENLIFSLRATGHWGRALNRVAGDALEMTGMSHKRDAYPRELSGGETAKVLLARAISGSPRILVLDEPTANLDGDSSWDIMCLLEELNRRGMTVLAASHDREMVSVMRKRVITLSAGRIVADERRAIYNTMASDILEERRIRNERQLSGSRKTDRLLKGSY